jgi:hypothetical protein
VPGNFCSGPSMSLLLLVVDLEGHAQHFLVFAFI